eukprot:CAMPEP_0178848284 /NCGR_PEP_ID=MMETSP0746-20121128/19219_1 /TAXON_ID=913974 /ORGANISM="Nitzschia punctata, Strain CCMP561" /LENGTH=37 /DNA_ID= /DNA_START= /DNA_END= /DNA_ORIENTATION=
MTNAVRRVMRTASRVMPLYTPEVVILAKFRTNRSALR